MMAIIIIYISFALFATFCGAIEAFLFHYKVNSSKIDDEINLHKVFTFQRLAAIVPILIYIEKFFIGLGNEPWINIILAILYVISLICSFSFFHDGMYYEYRHFLNTKVYPKGWFDEKKRDNDPTSAIIEFGNFERNVLFIVSILLLVIIYLYT